jgi:Leucine-rich repeat (LRR) protein
MSAVAKFGIKIMIFRLFRLLATSTFFLIVGCKQNPYTVMFNDNVVYSPNAALMDKVVSDPSLQACINQVLAANPDMDLEGIKLIACPGAGITTLEGIGNLPNLEQLDVSDNAISNLSPLLALKKLRVLSLRTNAIVNTGPLLSLPLLRFVSLAGNTQITCRDLASLEKKLGNTLDKPLTCLD